MATAAKDNAQLPMDLAVKLYKEHLAAGDPISFCAFATKFGVNWETLCQCVEGRKTRKEANSNMSWFTPEEDQVIIKFLIQIAENGFPDTKQYLRECVNTLIRAKQGDLTFSVGVNWVDHWLGCHKDQLQKYWNTSLNSTRANALNPTTVSNYFLTLYKVLTEHDIAPNCLWSMDETGLQFNHTPKKWVIGQAGNHQQHSIQCGS
jgi:hypothetical protein